MIKTAEELRARLEGKTERTEIEAILNGATIGAMKGFLEEEDYPCEGVRTWRKADFVLAVIDCVQTYNEVMTAVAEITAEVMSENETKAPAQEARITQPEALYEEDVYADNGGDNSAQEQDIPAAHIPDETPAPVKRQHTIRVIRLANKYAEARGTVEAILNGLKIFRKGLKVRASQGLPIDEFECAIKEVREKYREWRVEAFKLRRKLLRVMSATEIRLACEAYTARCEEIRRRHLARK